MSLLTQAVDIDSLTPIYGEEKPKITASGPKNSPLATQETDAPYGQGSLTGFTAPQGFVIGAPVDIDSLSFDSPVDALKARQIAIARDPNLRKPTMQRFAEFVTNPANAIVEFGKDYGLSSSEDIKLKPLAEDAGRVRKDQESTLLSNFTGIPKQDISENYNTLRTVFDIYQGRIAEVGANVGERVSPETIKSIVDATMTPAIVAGAIANPLGTAAGLALFTALDHIIPTEKFIPEDSNPDQRASIELLGMMIKGAFVGGVFKAAGKLDAKIEAKTGFSADLYTKDLMPLAFSKYAVQKLKENGLPDVVELAPEKVSKLREIESQNPQAKGVLNELGVSPEIAEASISGNSNVKIAAEKLVDVALRSEENFNKVVEVIKEPTIEELSAKPKETKPAGDKQSGVAKSIEQTAIEKGLTKKGYDELATFEGTTKEIQSGLISELMKDIDLAKRTATGKEPLPKDMKGSALLATMVEHATKTNDGALMLELAKSPLATEVSTAASELSLWGHLSKDTALGKIRELANFREKAVEKTLKGKAPAKVKESLKKDLKSRIEKEKPKKYDWTRLLDEVTC